MPKPRFSGGSSSMRRSSSQMLPAESDSSPAMQFNAVDLPQPDGPSSATNSPRRMLTVSPSSAATWRSPCAKRRVTASRRSSLKSCFRVVAPAEAGARLFGLLRSDLLVPDAEGFDLRLGLERLSVRELLQPLVVLGTPELMQRVLAVLRRHRERHVLHRRAGIEVALVVGQRLRLGTQQPRHQIEHHRELLRRDAL